jgi:hypothetical protein
MATSHNGEHFVIADGTHLKDLTHELLDGGAERQDLFHTLTRLGDYTLIGKAEVFPVELSGKDTALLDTIHLNGAGTRPTGPVKTKLEDLKPHLPVVI